MIRPSTFLDEHDAGNCVATITLNRPDRLNALTFESCDELRRTFRALNHEENLRATVGGFKLGMRTLDRLRPTVGAAACGMAARALDEALVHASTRRQFGQPLADLQLVREKFGRMATELHASRLLVYYAAWSQARGAERITLEAAMAKSYATEAAQHIIDEAIQIAGGAGVLVGHPVERLYRAVRALRIYEGATEVQRLIVGGTLLQERAQA